MMQEQQQPLLPSWQDISKHPAVQGLSEVWQYWMRKVRKASAYILERVWFQTVMFFLTVYALIGDDIRLACSTRDEDVFFNIVTITAFLLFAAELIASCLGK